MLLYRPGDPAGSFSRTSTATYRKEDSTLATAASGVLRDDHWVLNPATGVYERSVMLEGQRTNAWTYSEQLDNAAWSKGGVLITTNATTAPDGTSTADEMGEDTSSGAHKAARNLSDGAGGIKQAISVYCRAGARSWVYIETNLKDGSTLRSWLNLSAGVLGTASPSHESRITAYPDGWYRWELAVNILTGANTAQAAIGIATGDGITSYTGDGASGIYVWGIQYEANQPFASSYIKTEGTTVTRAADSLSLPFTPAPQAMTAYSRFVEGADGNIGSIRILQISDAADANPRLLIYRNDDLGYRGHHQTTDLVGISGLPLAAQGQFCESRLVLHGDGSVHLHQSLDGAAEAAGDRSAAVPFASAWSGQLLWLGSVGSSSAGFNAFTHVCIARGIRDRAYMRQLAGVAV